MFTTWTGRSWFPRATRWVLALGFAGALVACGPGFYYVEYDEVETEAAPPPPRVEPVANAPGPDYVWLPGYWYWTGQSYVWHAGSWGIPPAPHHVWVRSGWVHHRGRYHYVPGRWTAPNRVPPHQYYGHRPPPIR